MLQTLVTLMSGAIAGGCAVVAVIFLRFRKRTRDPFFAWFAAAFALLALEQVGSAVLERSAQSEVPLFLMRVVAFCLIIVAIWQKNRRSP
jgi:heme A synthase